MNPWTVKKMQFNTVGALADHGVAPISQEQVLSKPGLQVWGKVDKTRFLSKFSEFPVISFE